MLTRQRCSSDSRPPPPDHNSNKRPLAVLPAVVAGVSHVIESVGWPRPRGDGTPRIESALATALRSAAAMEDHGEAARNGMQASKPTCSDNVRASCSLNSVASAASRCIAHDSDPSSLTWPWAWLPLLAPIRAVISAKSMGSLCRIRAMNSSMSSLEGAAAPGSAVVGWSASFCARGKRTWKRVRRKRFACEVSSSSSSVSRSKSWVRDMRFRSGPLLRPIAPKRCGHPAQACNS
mmetsp:Transcript_37477/g.74332  ORF Transcript_37477/g.74332 Transcript_37477/m.74332 type:complete len:235 (-) Transcript_37477:1480-2184(-)